MATHNEVAHAWANKTGKHKRGFAMLYDGDVIYSWGKHFAIARHVTLDDCSHAVLFTTEGYSVSTAKHKTIVRRAVNGHRVFYVADVLADSHDAHMRNYNERLEHVAEIVKRAKRARTNGPWLAETAERILQEANEYADAFGLGQPHHTLADLDAALADALARREEAARKANEERAHRLRLQRIEQRHRINPLLVEWINGGNPQYSVGSNYAFRMRPFVRVKGNVVETTWGASVPLSAAVRAFRLAAQCRAKGEAWEPKGMGGMMIGDFALRRIGPTGNLVVGCHDIPFRHQSIAAARAGISLYPSEKEG